MQHHIAHLISQGGSGNQPDMVTAERIQAMSEWQPIETAPKDGTWFLALPPTGASGFGGQYPPTVCRVTSTRTRFDRDDIERHDGYYVECRAMNCATSTWELADFAYWMPLPDPPAQDVANRPNLGHSIKVR